MPLGEINNTMDTMDRRRNQTGIAGKPGSWRRQIYTDEFSSKENNNEMPSYGCPQTHSRRFRQDRDTTSIRDHERKDYRRRNNSPYSEVPSTRRSENRARTPYSASPSTRRSENRARTPYSGSPSTRRSENRARTPYSGSPSTRRFRENRTRDPSSGFNWSPESDNKVIDRVLKEAKVIFVGKPFLFERAKLL